MAKGRCTCLRRLAWAVLLIFLWGCSAGRNSSPPAGSARPGLQGTSRSTTGGTAGAGAQGAAPGQAGARGGGAVPAEVLLPPTDSLLTYYATGQDRITEQYIRDGARLIGAANQKTRVTWYINEFGVWQRDALDPTGSTWLRYLPPVLVQGLTWRQQSAGAEVWFRLTERTACGYLMGQELERCWELAMINRGTRTIYRFAAPYGVIHIRHDDLRDPKGSYEKELTRVEPGTVSTELRQRMYTDSDYLRSGPMPAVSEANPDQFVQAQLTALNAAGRPYRLIDLDADGVEERVEGEIGQATNHPLLIWNRDGLEVSRGYGSRPPHHADLIYMPWLDRPALMIRSTVKERPPILSLLWLRREGLTPTFGWHPKATQTFGNSVQMLADGQLEITWDMQDPAGHTWVRTYRIEPGTPWYRANLTREDFRPSGPQVQRPKTEADLITAAFVARWYNLNEELELYFADPGAADSFRARRDVERPPYLPGKAQVGKLIPPARSTDPPRLESASPGEDGSIEFMIRVQEYESSTYYTGRAVITKRADDTLVIKRLEFKRTSLGLL